MAVLLLLAAIAASSTAAAPDDPQGHFCVLKVRPESSAQLDYLSGLYAHSTDFDVDFWQPPSRVGKDVHVMVGPGAKDAFTLTLSRANLTASLMIDDVQRLIEEKEHPALDKRGGARRRYQDAVPGRLPFNLAQYHSHTEIGSATRRGIGRPKPAIWIDGGIHAREWVAPATALYFIHQLASGYEHDPEIRSLVDNIDWYILPVINPDGYEYSRSSTNPRVRLWRKNRSPPQCRRSLNFFQGERCCQGVDLNRNFDFHFGGEGSSADPCEEIYKGQAAFSEPESRAVRDFLSRPGTNFQGFITMHSYSQIWMYPYGHKRRTYPQDVADLKSVAIQARAALASLYGTQYAVGTGADTLYPASGGSDDWAKDVAGIKFVYLLELRPEDSVWDGFILNPREILPTARETWEGVKVVAKNIEQRSGATSGWSGRGNSVVEPATAWGSNTPVMMMFLTMQELPVVESTLPVLGASAECRDELATCARWARHDGCSVWRGLNHTCRLSCGLCTPAPATPYTGRSSSTEKRRRQCWDGREDCGNWHLLGLCNWVKHSCRLSCGFC